MKLLNILFAFSLLLLGCGKEGDSTSGLSLSVDQTKLTLSGGGESKVVTVTTDGAWKASCPEADNWCILAIVGDKLTVAAAANTSENSRKTRITVSAEGVEPSFVEVVQEATSFPGLPAEVLLSTSGKEQTFIVLTQKKLTVSIPTEATWCTILIVGNQVYVSGSRNAGESRQVVVTISDGAASASVTVKQKSPAESRFAVGDLFKENGVVTGVVASVDEDGEGLVLALDELSYNDKASSIWSYFDVMNVALATTKDDGQKNMEIWRSQSQKDRFKAFKVCDEKNKNGAKDWFLASQDEWLNIYKGITGYGMEKFNQVIKGIEGAKPMTTAPYWSSTESETNVTEAIVVKFMDGFTPSIFKGTDSQASTRAVRKLE